MERWIGRLAVVTGTSSGIGAEVAKQLVKKGLNVVGLARRVERVEALAKSLNSEKGKLHAFKCDVSKEEEVKKVFKWTKENLGSIDILINNAAVGPNCTTIDGPIQKWKDILDINVLGLSICTKEAVNIMKEKGIDDGHIIHINRIGGEPVVENHVMYSASKHSVRVLTEGLRRELIKQNSKIRVTSISPGLVRTEMPPQEMIDNLPILECKDIADVIMFVLGTPPHVQ
ncbi:hypothetical protein L9F63_020634, partial [Diploptera punctata]